VLQKDFSLINFLPKWIVTFEKSYNEIIQTIGIFITVKAYIIKRTTEIGIFLGYLGYIT